MHAEMWPAVTGLAHVPHRGAGSNAGDELALAFAFAFHGFVWFGSEAEGLLAGGLGGADR